MHNNDQSLLLASLMSQLSAQEKAQLDSLMADKDAQKKILATPQAQEMMEKFLKGGKF